jgi:hypothetical protein
LEDETGHANLIVYGSVYERFRLIARHAAVLLARGHVERQSLSPKSGEAAVVHLIVRTLERVDMPEPGLPRLSRDFH